MVPQPQKTRLLGSIEYSSGYSLGLSGVIAHDGNEQLGDAGCAYLAERGEFLAIEVIGF